MKAYERVAHTMIPLRPISEAQQDWIDANANLVVEFADWAFEGDQDALAMLSFAVQTAAETIWALRGSKAHWRDFDVDRYAATMSRGSLRASTEADLWIGLHAFVWWLVDTERLRDNEADPILRNLAGRAEPFRDAPGDPELLN